MRKKIAINRSGANAAAFASIQAGSGLTIVPRQSKYHNNIVEQDHLASKHVGRPILGFKILRVTRISIAGIETMHIIRKGQLADIKDQTSSAANQFAPLTF